MFKRLKNFFFCLKYPFWKARNVWTGKSCGYSFTEYDAIPEGWRKAFGKQLSKELKKVLKETHYLKKFRFSEIKEKWGELCLYCFDAPEEVFEVLDKYERMSKHYCIHCGKPSEFVTKGWILYICKDCAHKAEINNELLKPISKNE